MGAIEFVFEIRDTCIPLIGYDRRPFGRRQPLLEPGHLGLSGRRRSFDLLSEIPCLGLLGDQAVADPFEFVEPASEFRNEMVACGNLATEIGAILGERFVEGFLEGGNTLCGRLGFLSGDGPIPVLGGFGVGLDSGQLLLELRYAILGFAASIIRLAAGVLEGRLVGLEPAFNVLFGGPGL
jgi:hypothetical protein